VVVVQRQNLLESKDLFALTGFVDEKPEEEGDLFGGAAKLERWRLCSRLLPSD
jgi:hypothetical protein